MIEILFNSINVLVLILAGVYLFRTRIRQAMIAALAKLKSARAQMQQEIVQAHTAHDQLQRDIQAQKTFAKNSADRVARWRETENQRIENLRAALEAQQKSMIAKQEIQRVAVQHQRMVAQLLPQAVEQATIALQREYENPTRARQYLQDIAKELK
jgi:hypothetical protein